MYIFRFIFCHRQLLVPYSHCLIQNSMKEEYIKIFLPTCHHYKAEISPIWRKTTINQSINQSILSMFVYLSDCLGLSVPDENFTHMDRDVTITGERLQILTYSRHSCLWAITVLYGVTSTVTWTIRLWSSLRIRQTHIFVERLAVELSLPALKT